MTDKQDPTTYNHVNRLEAPLTSVRKPGDALALITETIEEPGASAMNEIIHTMLRHLSDVDDIYSELFRLHHPDRERFEQEGRWLRSEGAASYAQGDLR